MYFISFDIATKSLAISIIKYEDDEKIYSLIEEKYKTYQKNKDKHLKTPLKIYDEYIDLLKYTNDILSRRYQIKYLHVVDLIPDKKLKETTTVERTLYLNQFLQKTLKEKIQDIPLDERMFLIEYQMGPNDKSRVISSQILLYCATFCDQNIEVAKNQIKLVGPSLKNKIFFPNDPQSHHSYYLDKYKTNYAANKNHTKYLLKKITNIYKQNDMLRGISKKNLDDAADAFCMTIAYIFCYLKN